MDNIMKKKLIIINGVMGVGKTTISKNLYKALENSFWLDGDNCWSMNPFIVNNENKSMVLNNIGFIINNFLKNSSSKYVIFNWVIQSDTIMEDVLRKIKTENIEIYKITLMCTKEDLIKRIEKDIALGLRDINNIKRSLDRYELYKNMDTIKIDTTGKEIVEIVNEIIELIEVEDGKVNEKISEHKNEFILNLDKLHTTKLGIERIKRNLSLDINDVVKWCYEKIKKPNAVIMRKGKNWYINVDQLEITVNAYSFTIITAHKNKKTDKNLKERV